MPDSPPRRPPASPASRRRLLMLALFVSGIGAGYAYWQRNNGGFPLDVMKHVQSAQRLIRDADALSDSQATQPQRLKLLQQAEQALTAALDETETQSPLASGAPPKPTPLVPMPLFIDPALPPHILSLLGTVCQLQGEAKWATAELYYLAAVRLLAQERNVEEERLKQESSGKYGPALHSEVLEYLDGRLLSVGRQLGGLYTLMRSDVAAEATLLRCLQLLADVRLQQQSKQPNTAKSITVPSSAKRSASSDNMWRTVASSEFDDDVTAEISEQLSAVFRMRGDYLQAVNWTVNALKMNDKAARAPVTESTFREEAAVQRKVRELHLYDALASDSFSLYLSPPTQAESMQSPNSASLLDSAYHAAVHALEALQSLINNTAQPTTNGNKARTTKPSASTSSTSTSVLVSSKAAASSASSQQQQSPPMRGAPLNLLPSTSHQPFLSSATVDRLFGLPPSAQRSELLVEAVAAYSNLASVMCARGEEREADAAWAVAEKAARLTGDTEYLNVINEQKSMLREQPGSY